MTLSSDSFPCTFTIAAASPNLNASENHSVWESNDPNTRRLRPGVFCSTGEIHLSDARVTGTVTFIGTQIQLSGSEFNLSPYRNDVLVRATDTTDDNDAIKVSGSSGTWRVTLYARGGQAQLSGSDLTSPSGSIIANRVKLNGSRLRVTRDGTGGRRWPRLVG